MLSSPKPIPSTVRIRPSFSGRDLRLRFQRSKYLLLLVLPGVLYFVLFHYLPMYGITLAFKEYNSYLGIFKSPWVGFEHFERFFAYPHFWKLIRNTFLLSFYSMVFGFPAPIILALMLNEVRSTAFKKTVQTVSFLPHFISTVAVVGMIVLFLSPSTGFVNDVIKALGLEPVYFLIIPGWFRPIYIISDIWQGVGWGAIVYLAALSQVSPELYESATIDGANRFQRIRFISVPSILPTIMILLILRMGRLLSVGFEKVLLLYNPQTYEVADVISTYVYRRGLQMAEFGYGTAVGLFNAVVNLSLIIAANYFGKRVTEVGLW